MKILTAKRLAIPEIKVITFARFCDHRGYFTEQYRRSDVQSNMLTPFLQDLEFVQMNESFSNVGTVRGLHFQWNPYMGKMVRTVHGHMVDLVLDIRKGSPTFGKIIAYDMPDHSGKDFGEWIWIPPGFAHGNLFLQNTTIEYLCSGEYSIGCEAGISPLATDIDWSLCEPQLKDIFLQIAPSTSLITDKDKNALSVEAWEKNENSNNFIYAELTNAMKESQ